MPFFCIDVGAADSVGAAEILICRAVASPVQDRRLDLSGFFSLPIVKSLTDFSSFSHINHPNLWKADA